MHNQQQNVNFNQSTAETHESSDDWSTNYQYQNIDSIINDCHKQYPNVNTTDYNHLFDLLPFDTNTSSPNTTNDSLTIQDHLHSNIDTSNEFINNFTSNNPISNTVSRSNAMSTDFNNHSNDMFSFQYQEENNASKSMLSYFNSINENDYTISTKEDSIMNSMATTLSLTETASPSQTISSTSSTYPISTIQQKQQQQQVQNPYPLNFQSTMSTTSHTNSSSTQNMIDSLNFKSSIQAYLQSSDPTQIGERTVIIMTSKVAQKSYGSEKRFLCPPPSIILAGSSWWTTAAESKHISFCDKDNQIRVAPVMNITISGESNISHSGKIEWYGLSGSLIGQTGGSNIQKSKKISDIETKTTVGNDDWYRNTKQEALAGGRCILKRLYINDVDEKRKKVECVIKLQLANGLKLGTFSSRIIKVVSKPSRKRQSMKNTELCLYHGTTISLFNRVRSQTVSTKYLGVSSTSGKTLIFDYPGRSQVRSSSDTDTCFVARTNTWDPFIVWIVNPTQERMQQDDDTVVPVEDYIGNPNFNSSIPYPNPPKIALKNQTNQPISVQYNQRIVLQCLTTGLVSPVMVIRKVDKTSTVIGGARFSGETDRSYLGGGEFGNEVLGDPVSQFHKVAFQIVQQEHQQTNFNFFQQRLNEPEIPNEPATYLACLNDLVGVHKTAGKRTAITKSTLESAEFEPKRRASMVDKPLMNSYQYNHSLLIGDSNNSARRRMSSLSDSYKIQSSHPYLLGQRSNSISVPNDRRNSTQNSSQIEFGSYWTEEVTDAAVWTIVGTDCAKYTFWMPPNIDETKQEYQASLGRPFPYLTHFAVTGENNSMMTLVGENFTRDTQVWFDDIQSPFTEYRGRNTLVCHIPTREELMQSVRSNGASGSQQRAPFYSVNILLVRDDGVVYKTSQSFLFN